MNLSEPAWRLISELQHNPEAFLFGSQEEAATVRLVTGSEYLFVPRQVVDELLGLGHLDGGDIGERNGKTYFSYSLSNKCRSALSPLSCVGSA